MVPEEGTSPVGERFKGIRVAVTGGARGIGAAVVDRFLLEGAHVLAIDLDPNLVDRIAARAIDKLSASIFDITDPVAWKSALGVGRAPQVLVHCAGLLGPETQVKDLNLDEWEQVLRINLTGTFVSCQAVLPGMLQAGHGRIVLMASIAGKEGNPGQSAYSAAKGGIIALTKALAKEVATAGITVNCVAPTVVEGPFSSAMTEELRESILKKIPMRRFARADEVASLIAWIASNECSFNTGVCFDLSGGRATY